MCAKLLGSVSDYMRQATCQRMEPYAQSYGPTDGAVWAKILADGLGLHALSYWLVDGAICAKLLANGWGHMRQATC